MKRSEANLRISRAGPMEYKDKWFGSAGSARPGRCSLCRREFYPGQMVDFWYEGRKLHVIHHGKCPTKAQAAKRAAAIRKYRRGS